MANTPEDLKNKIRKGGYDVGVTHDDTGHAIPPSHNGPNDGVQPGQSDLSKKTRITLGRYLSATTIVNKNVFPVSFNATGDTVHLTNDHGNPVALEQNPNDGVVFTAEIDQGAPSAALVEFKTSFKKGKNDIDVPDGHVLLKNHVADIKTRYTSAVLKSNRFNVDNQYRADLRNPGDSDASLSYYARKKAGDTDHLDTAAPNEQAVITSRNMQNISKVLMLRSTGELGANGRDFNPNANIGAILPGLSQLLPAQTINSRDLEARDVLEAMINEEVGSRTPGPDTSSWGALNNQLEPFSGILPIGMIALCVALIIATQIVFELLGLILGLVTDKPKYAFDQNGIAVKGKFRFTKESKGLFGGLSIGGISDLNSLLGLRDTQYPYKESFSTGMDIFFGKNPDNPLSGVADSFGSSFKKALESPGFYIIFCRAIVRSGYGIGKKLTELGSNPLAIAQGIMGIIDDLRSSKIIAAYNMFAGLGDAALREKFAKSNSLNQDEIPNGAPGVYKSRLKGSRALAWRQAYATSLYNLPDVIKQQAALATVLAAGAAPLGAIVGWDTSSNNIDENGITKVGNNIYSSPPGENRIPIEIVKKIEADIDGEYVPFYFHDMRTNEIIQFRAFLLTLTEDFTPSWENIEAYGRVDPVRIYKNTSRRISLSFRVISLDPDDFDNMWFKINKLVTLVYPQWSQGKRVSAVEENITFSQPFSQLISSSPIIRMRVGDLVRSNYSKFALTRIFDLDEGTGEINKKRVEISSKLEKIKESISALQHGSPTKEQISDVKAALDSKMYRMVIESNTYITFDPPEAESLGIPVIGKKKKSGEGIQYTGNLKVAKILSMTSENELIVEIADKEFEETQKTNKVGVKFGKHLGFILISDIAKLIPNGNNQSLAENASEFLDSKTNPIVKYFENNMGKGLAGTIDSLGFNWLEENTWYVLEPGSQAPKSCTVTISFTAIHDIAPGIDHTGFNRAPVYRVGKHIASITGGDEAGNTKKKPTQPEPEDKSSSLIPKL